MGGRGGVGGTLSSVAALLVCMPAGREDERAGNILLCFQRLILTDW